MARAGRAMARVRRRFLRLPHGSPRPAAVPVLLPALDPGGLPNVLRRLLENYASGWDGAVSALAGKAQRRSFAAAATRAGASGAGLRSRVCMGVGQGPGED